MAWLTVVRSRSMEPTLRDGTLWLTRPFGRRTVRRGDVVVADSAELGRRIIKRVVGLPGELLVVADGRTSVDGRPLDEPYATPSVFRGTFTVPRHHYLLLGDNRELSDDARSWQQPYLGREALVGRLVAGRRRARAGSRSRDHHRR